MKEFGSDFHYCADIDFYTENVQAKSDALFFANGRQALQDIIVNNFWKRIWVPTYFCYEIIDAIKETGIIVELYPDAPTLDDIAIIDKIPFEDNDVLLRMNFFGLRAWRDNSAISVEVIEDHSHDLIGSWASKSNADWCFASLRKTLPIPEGGILWSPRNLLLPHQIASSVENDLLSYKRLSAMLLKTLYLYDKSVSKKIFRQLFIETEDAFSSLEKSSMSEICMSMYRHFNIQNWYKIKSENWVSLSTVKTNKVSVLLPENIEKCNPFSLILKFKNRNDRDSCRRVLVENGIYPALLWSVPVNQDKKIVNISNTLLSLHCDARYSSNDIKYLRNKIINIISAIN